MPSLRLDYLRRQTDALIARAEMLQGRRFTFDEESQALVRRGRADAFRGLLPRVERADCAGAAGRRRADRSRGSVPHAVRHSAREARRRVQRGHRRLPREDDAADGAPAGREVHRRVREQQVLERLQLVSGQFQQPDSGEHRFADLHRPRDRPGLPRGLSRPSRLQLAPRENHWSAIAAGWSSRCTRCFPRSR